MSNETIRFEDWQKLIRWGTHKYMRWLYKAGAHSVQYDDVFSELCVAFCIARDHWDPAGGANFATFLTRGMDLHIRRWVQREIYIQHATPMSLDARHGKDDDSSMELGEVIEDETARFEGLVEQRQLVDRLLHRLTPRARQYVTFLINPPDEFLAVSRAVTKRGAYARQRGYERFVARDGYSNVVFDLMGASHHERAKIRKQIHQKAEAIWR